MQTNRRPGKRAIFRFLGLLRADFATGQTSYGFRTNAGVDGLAFSHVIPDRSCSFTFHNLFSTEFSSTEFVRDGAAVCTVTATGCADGYDVKLREGKE